MSFLINHDYHIHSMFSLCSGHPEQTPANILAYAKKNGFREICLTDHFWDEKVETPSLMDFYALQGLENVKKTLPLPEDDEVLFHFGCETDMDKLFHLGIAPETMDEFEFIIVSTTHFNIRPQIVEDGITDTDALAELYVKRIDALLSMDLPFSKMGLAHLNCPLIASEYAPPYKKHLEILNAIDDKTFSELFTRAAKVGIGIELNMLYEDYTADQLPSLFRPLHLAKACGCKFYLGGDGHTPEELALPKARFEKFVSHLQLTENDRFVPFGFKGV